MILFRILTDFGPTLQYCFEELSGSSKDQRLFEQRGYGPSESCIRSQQFETRSQHKQQTNTTHFPLPEHRVRRNMDNLPILSKYKSSLSSFSPNILNRISGRNIPFSISKQQFNQTAVLSILPYRFSQYISSERSGKMCASLCCRPNKNATCLFSGMIFLFLILLFHTSETACNSFFRMFYYIGFIFIQAAVML